MSDERIGLELDLGQSIADVRALDAALQTMSVSTSGHVVTGMHQFDQSVKATASSARIASNAVAEAQRSTADFGRGIQSVSYIVQDFTSVVGSQGLAGGLRAVQNNIPQLLTQLGSGAGLAGVVSLVALGVGLLVDNWGRLTAAFKGGATQEEIKAMEDLAEAAKKANDAILKTAESVEGDEVTARKRNFRQSLVEYGGGKKLLDDLSKGNEQDRVFFAQRINEALKGDAGSAEVLGMANAQFGRIQSDTQAAEAIKEDEAENERRVKAREKRREDERRTEENKNRMMAKAMREDEATHNRTVAQEEKDKAAAEREAEKQQRDAEKAQQDAIREADRQARANLPSPAAMEKIGKMRIAENDIRRLADMQMRGAVGWEEANQQIMDLQQVIIQIQGQHDAANQGARRIDTRMGRLR